jgi:hypothetical protein
MSSLPVVMANLIVARTAYISGARLLPSDPAFPVQKNERLPIILCEQFSMPSHYVFRFVHLDRKCATVSAA